MRLELAAVSSPFVPETSLHYLHFSRLCKLAPPLFFVFFLPLPLPLVPPLPESMILLGSIERAQLQSLLSQQLGRARRLQYIRERAVEEKKRLSIVSDPASDDNGSQRTSQEVRFQVRGCWITEV